MIKVVTNALESGDWIRVRGHANTIIWEGHSIRPNDLREILNIVDRQGCILVETDDLGLDDE